MDLANGQAVSTVPAGPSLRAAELIILWQGPALYIHYITTEIQQHEHYVNSLKQKLV
jgi:hypothetical protein